MNEPMQLSLTRRLAYRCATLRAETLNEAVKDRVRYLLLDFLAVTLRGSLLSSSQNVYDMLNSGALGVSNDALSATIFGREERMEASWAALANGVASHGLELDDVENQSSLHPGVVVFPATLALAESLNSNIEDFYAAIVAGYEVTLRVGAALHPASVYERGFHPTAICGTLGASVASARLLKLSPEQTTMALGIAGSMAAGSMAYLDEGAWTKRLHPGWSSHAGIVAARLAQAGFISPTNILESRYGTLHAYSSAGDMSKLEQNEDDEPLIMQVSLKPYACCRYMHGPIDCLLSIRQEHHPEPEQIVRISCGVLTGGRGLVMDPIEQKRESQTIVDAQFSMPYGAAIALLTGKASLSVFTEEWLRNAQLRSLMHRVECFTSSELDAHYPAEWRASASVEMRDGRVFEATVRYPLGDPHNPLSPAQLEARFHEIVAPVIQDKAQRTKVIERVRQLRDVKIM